MPILYDTSAAIIIRGLNSLDSILTKAEQFAKEKDIDPTKFLEARIYEDMLPLTAQIHFATDTAQKVSRRSRNEEPEKWEMTELVTWEDCRKRIAKTLEIAQSVDAGAFDAFATETVDIPLGPNRYNMAFASYIQGYSLPNFFFHLQTTYCILRAQGVPLSKLDYLTPFIGDFTKEDVTLRYLKKW